MSIYDMIMARKTTGFYKKGGKTRPITSRSNKSNFKIIIKGDRRYTKRMYEHLREEHPSTRKRMTLA